MWPGRSQWAGLRPPCLHTHTPHIGYGNQQPRDEACTGTGRTTQAWGPELPRAPDTSASHLPPLREGHGEPHSPQRNQPGWDWLEKGLRGEGKSQAGGRVAEARGSWGPG